MEDVLEDLLNQLVRPLTSASAMVSVAFNGSSLVRMSTPNRTAPIAGTETLSYQVVCKAKSRKKVLELAKKVRSLVVGKIPESVDRLLTPLWCPSFTYVGEVEDGYFQASLALATTLPYKQELTIC